MIAAVPEQEDLAPLEALIGHKFANPDLLVTALTHRSYANERGAQVGDGQRPPSDNERLEFLGDAVLDLVVGHILMEAYPGLTEGQLSVTRAQVVSEAGLSKVAEELGLGGWLRLGKGEDRSGGREKSSILADSCEAVIAAVYLDGGFDAAWRLVVHLFQREIQEVETTGFYDHKTRLQELAQARLRATPVYLLVGESGPDHAKIFEVAVEIGGREWARATGRSKKRAEQMAAANAAFMLLGADLDSLGDGDGEPS